MLLHSKWQIKTVHMGIARLLPGTSVGQGANSRPASWNFVNTIVSYVAYGWSRPCCITQEEEVGQNPIEMNVTRDNKRLFCTGNRTCQEIAWLFKAMEETLQNEREMGLVTSQFWSTLHYLKKIILQWDFLYWLLHQLCASGTKSNCLSVGWIFCRTSSKTNSVWSLD